MSRTINSNIDDDGDDDGATYTCVYKQKWAGRAHTHAQCEAYKAGGRASKWEKEKTYVYT